MAMKIHSKDSGTMKRACSALCNLSFENEKNCETIASNNGIEKLMLALSNHASNMGIVTKVVSAFRNLTRSCDDTGAKKEFLREKGISQIARIMKDPESNADLQGQCCSIMTNITKHNEENRLAVLRKNIIPLVLTAMDTYPKYSVFMRKACTFLHSLSTIDDTNNEEPNILQKINSWFEEDLRTILVDAGAISRLADVLRSFPEDPELLKVCCLALKNLSYDSKGAQNIVKLISEKTFESYAMRFPKQCKQSIKIIFSQVNYSRW